MDIKKTFIGSRMNKSLDERLIPNGEYTDALNIRISSDEDGEAGSVENAKGNEAITSLEYDGSTLTGAKCIGVVTDDSKETIYWFVTSPTVDMIVSYNMNLSLIRYHVVSETVLNFNDEYPINGVNLIDDLLFWTDNFNQPRRINVTETYPQPVAGVDQITEDDISVIVKPPISAPTIQLVSSSNYDNYIEDRFIRFAYRYKYKNGEYSALSEFSDLAFSPGQFRMDYSSYDMIGMRNLANEVNVTFNTGDKRVVGIDLCFKQSNSDVVNVIERFDKNDEGWSNDDDERTITFKNQKIYTTLQQSELLRLYDNVPRTAKSQTTMGNRIFYGNYVDGYDIDTKIDYDLELLSEEIGVEDIDVETSDGVDYTIDTTTTISNSQIDIDLSGVNLVEGASIYINFNINNDSFGGDASYDTSVENSYASSFQFILPRDYSSVDDLATDADFLAAIELTDTVANASDGYSLSDLFYASMAVASDWELVDGGVTSLGQGFVVSNSGNILSLQVPALQIEDTFNPLTYAYEYFVNSGSTSAIFIELNSRQSLHSNRDYEVGIVYLDEYNRASTVLVDTENTIHVPANLSENKNSINVTINREAPSWAKRYRLMMKPSKGSYETIYSNIFFYDEIQVAWWLKLEGDNQTKCNVGDVLYVKKDSSGATNDVVRCKVLDIKTLEEDEITGVDHPSGLYMKIKNSGFNISKQNEDFIGRKFSRKNSDVIYPMYMENPDYVEGSTTITQYMPIPISAGSEVEIYFNNSRNGSGNSCRPKRYQYDKSFIAAQDYDSIYDFIVSQNINFSEPSNDPSVDSSGDVPTAEFIDTVGDENDFQTIPIYNFPISNILNLTRENYVTKIAYYYDSSSGKAWLGFKNAAGASCGGRPYYLDVRINIYSGSGLLVFETEPEEINNEVFFESHKSYPITDRWHSGNIQDQVDVTTPCIVSLDMFNCFTFGNGVESFKINDALATPGFNIGERVSAVSEQDYKEANRYADVTYSGIYNEETNINNLNVFNLGLANYRSLERLFGPINRLHGRQTDLLVLQEDKISYLLAGKNLLSDAAGGGTLTSVPEVLGTQVSRIEEFGISDDADTFDAFGYDVFFTDSKRGAVINLRGGSSGSDQLNVISNMGMRSWFRDKFRETDKKFKVGAFDPYSNEYVLSFLDDEKPFDPEQVGCGSSISGSGDFSGLVLQTTTAIGEVTLEYNVNDSTDIKIVYDGSIVVDTTITGTGSLTFDKTLQDVNEYSVTVTSNDSWQFTFGCVEPVPLSLVTVVTSDQLEANGSQGVQEFYWTNGTVTSASSNYIVDFIESPLDYYTVESGFESEGYFPAEGSTVVVKAGGLNRGFFVGQDKMYYMISDTLYSDISDIISNATEITNVQQITDALAQGTFPYVNPSNNAYVYIIVSYRKDKADNPPYAYPQTVEVDKNTATSVTLNGFDTDGDPITYSVVTSPSHGVLTGTVPNLTYTPDTDFVGLDSFTFKVNDGTNDSNIATVTLPVTEPSEGLTEFDISAGGTSTSNDACTSLETSTTRFHDGSLAVPGIGDVVYLDEAGTVPMNGLDLWYKTGIGTVIQIDNNGEVTDTDIC